MHWLILFRVPCNETKYLLLKEAYLILFDLMVLYPSLTLAHCYSEQYRTSIKGLLQIFIHYFVLQENVSLIKEINDLRKELKIARTQIHDLEAALGLHSKNNKGDTATLAAFTIKTPSALMERDMEEKNKIIDMQKIEIRKLRNMIETGSRPSSSQRLPPMPLEMSA